jgi:prophage tail gpP-like protein
MVDYQTELGSPQDRVTLTIAGSRLPNYVSYTVSTGVFKAPSNWTVTLGAGRPNKDALTAGELLRMANPGASFEMRIGETLVQTGIVEDRDINDNGGTTVTVAGRDWMSKLVKNGPLEEIDFGQPTYFELTRKVLDLCGLEGHKLSGDNEAHRKAVSRSVKATSNPMTDVVESIETPTLVNANTKVNLQRVVGKIGGNWFDFLKSQYKKVGLFLWCTATGDFVLSRPVGTKSPIYRIIKRRNIPRTMTATVQRQFSDHTSQRHAHAWCYGKGNGGKKGVSKFKGSWTDFELTQYGLHDYIVQHESEAQGQREAEYHAKRKIAEDRRDGWVLRYTVSGHTTPAMYNPSQMLIWTPDTTALVVDEPLGDLFGENSGAMNSRFASGQDMFVEDIEFSRGPQTTTKIRVMRKQDLYYLGESTEFESDETKTRPGPG